MSSSRCVPVGVLIAIASACSGGGGDGDPIDAPDTFVDAAIDASPCLDCDGGLACAAWMLVPRTARSIQLFDERHPFNAGRTFRVMIEYDSKEDEEPAMPAIGRGAGGGLVIQPMVFASIMPAGGPTITRRLIVPLRLQNGTFTLTAGTAPAPMLTVTVERAPARPCGGVIGCGMDCDCNERAGERCLSGTGIGGGFLACARPCQLDRDCDGNGRCESFPDGLAFTCATGQPECSAAEPCPDGFACTQGACAPTFTLSAETRHTCTCDRDCETGLRCITSSTMALGRCQAPCPTGGPWCEGIHACGTAEQDTSGLATTDSVCGEREMP